MDVEFMCYDWMSPSSQSSSETNGVNEKQEGEVPLNLMAHFALSAQSPFCLNNETWQCTSETQWNMSQLQLLCTFSNNVYRSECSKTNLQIHICECRYTKKGWFIIFQKSWEHLENFCWSNILWLFFCFQPERVALDEMNGWTFWRAHI